MRTALKAIAAGVGMTASVSAMSMPLYSDWTAEVRAGFTDFAPDPGVDGLNPTMLSTGMAPTTLEWGTAASGAGRSSLVVSSSTPLDIMTNGALVNSGSITHNNFPILRNSASLTNATLRTEVALTSGPLGPIDDFIVLNINFFETPNFPSSGVCAGQPGEAPGVPGINDEGCADIFVVDVTGAGFNAAGQIVRNLGNLGDPGFLYTAVIEIQGAVALTQEECLATAGVNQCVGFLTGENRQSVATTSLGIFAREVTVPAPAPILGLGLGLLMMARARRRKS